MLTKCANPACSARFRYLHEGKLFSLEMNAVAGAHDGAEFDATPHHVQYFWLCNACAAHMTVARSPDGAVVAVPLKSRALPKMPAKAAAA